MIDFTRGRHCAICKKPGGTPVTLALRGLGIAGTYAHAPCIAKARKRQRAAHREDAGT